MPVSCADGKFTGQARVLGNNHELTGKSNGLHDAEGSDCSRRRRAGCVRGLTAYP